MTRFLLAAYTYFKDRRILFFSLMAGLLLVSSFLALQIQPEEDIRKMIPADDRIDKLNLVLENSKFTDKLILNLAQADTSGEPEPDLLTEVADSLASILQRKYQPEIISEITYKVPSNVMTEVYSTFYANLPLFLDDQDYAEIEKMIRPDAIQDKIGRNFRTLISPASLVLKQFIQQDPLRITPLGLKKLQALEFDQNYALHDGYLMTRDQRNLSFFISPAISSQETARNTAFYASLDADLQSLKDQFQGKIDFVYFGASAVAVGNASQIKQDIRLTVTIALLILIVFITWFFRRKLVFLALFVPVIFGAAVAMSLVSVFDGNISMIALGIGSVLLGIALDYSLHIFTHFRSTGSVETTIRDLTTPLSMTCLTTASAFLCLAFVHSEALHELGIFAAIAVVCAAFFSLLILPQLLKKGDSNVKTEHQTTFFDRIAAYPYHKNKYLALGILSLTGLFLFTYDKVEFESDLNRMNYVSPALKAAEQKIANINSYTLKSVFLVAEGPDLEAALQQNEKVAERVQELVNEGLVDKFTTVGLILKPEKVQLERIEAWNAFWQGRKESTRKLILTEGEKLGFTEDAFQQFFDLLHKDFQPVKPEAFQQLRDLFLKEYISENEKMATVTTVLKVKPENRAMVFQRLEKDESISILDKSWLTSRFIEILKEDFNKLVMVSLVLVFLILFLSFGSLDLAFFTFLPMALSWLWTLGIMGLLGIKFNIFNIIISTFVFGLGIDYSIFVTRGLMQEYSHGRNNLNSYKTSILLSMVTTLAGIGVLIFATHPALKSIASISVIGIVSVVLISFTIQPIILNFLFLNRKRKGRYPFNIFALARSIFAFVYFFMGCMMLTIAGILLPISKRKPLLWFHILIMLCCRSLIYIMANVRKNILNEVNEQFETPGIIICNHQSFLDLLAIQMVHPKMVLLTNDWTYNSPFFGKVVQWAGYYYVAEGYEKAISHLKDQVEKGYSIMVFPEGTRSPDCVMKRFKKGAFFLADELKLDIIPVVLHGFGHTMTKGDDALLKNGQLTMKYLPRIKHDDAKFGTGYSERTKLIGRYFKSEFHKLSHEIETPAYFHNRMINNYRFKGWKLLWLLRSVLRVEHNFDFLIRQVPVEGKIVEFGCGYGYLSYLMAFTAEKRQIISVDQHEEKIIIARNCFSNSPQNEFIRSDLMGFDIPEADAFILRGLENQIDAESQEKLLRKCVSKLRPGGKILIQQDTLALAGGFWGMMGRKLRGKGEISPVLMAKDRVEKISRETECNFEKLIESSGKVRDIYVLEKQKTTESSRTGEKQMNK